MPSDAPLTLSLLRFSALLAALRDGPLNRHDLLKRLGDAYPRTASARPMVDRDVRRLAELGIVIEISRTRPPIYILRGGVPSFDTADLQALAIIRDTFGDRHPQVAQVRRLLERLTSQLGEADRRAYQRRQARRAHTPLWVGPAVFNTLRNEKLLDAVESIIGPEIYSNPVQHVRLKPPEHLTPKDAEGRVQLGKTPVHQDNGVILPEADQTDVLTVWFPLWDATVENGCLVVWPNSHRQGLLDHCPSHGGLRIPGKLLNGKAKSMPMKRGDALFMHKLTAHASHSNHSANIRWSFDLRYNPIGQPTGRGSFPGFIARSRQNSATDLRDPAEWARLWHAARHMLATEGMGPFNRWSADSPVCA